MASFGLREAARQAGVAKSTIHRAILRGRLSAARTADGGYAIDASELFRLYPPRSSALRSPNGVQGHDAPEPKPIDATDATGGTDATARLARLEAENAALRTLLDRERTLLEAALTEARAQRDSWQAQAERLALAGPARRSWWPWRRSV
jgi:hypothetical protein